MNAPIRRHPASYRDPAGFVFEQDGDIFRQVNTCYKAHYDKLMTSGLYDRLVQEGLLIPHEELSGDPEKGVYKVLQPQKLAFISYPYEWCFSQLKAAALATLQIQRLSLEYGMSLKDASPYNIQFETGRPVFIDTLSWEILDVKKPWIAYRQFCESFLAPLALGHYGKQSVNRAMLSWPEGIPLSLCSKLLPFKSTFRIDLALHLHLHARISSRSGVNNNQSKSFSLHDLKQSINSLVCAVKNLNLPEAESGWSAYYEEAASRNEYLVEKNEVIDQWLRQIGPVELALDAGCNTGQFSLKLSDYAKQVIAIDYDECSIERLHHQTQDPKQEKHKKIFSCIQDLTRLSPGNGLLEKERKSFFERGPFDLVLGLALIHHLLISRQVPLSDCAALFAKLTRKHIILEFIPQYDPWSRILSESVLNDTHGYEKATFELAFQQYFKIIAIAKLANTDRILYRLERI